MPNYARRAAGDREVDLLARRGQLDEALAEHYREARRVLQVSRGEEHVVVGQVVSSMGEVLARQGQLDEAASAYAEATRCLADAAAGGYPSAGWSEWPLDGCS